MILYLLREVYNDIDNKIHTYILIITHIEEKIFMSYIKIDNEKNFQAFMFQDRVHLFFQIK